MNQEQEIKKWYGGFFFVAIFAFIFVFMLNTSLVLGLTADDFIIKDKFDASFLLQTNHGCSFPPANFKEFICATIDTILSPLIPILFTLALIAFFWGVGKYVIQGASDEKAREQGKQIMIWGIVGLFVMVSVWGLVILVQDTFNLNDTPFNASQIKLGL